VSVGEYERCVLYEQTAAGRLREGLMMLGVFNEETPRLDWKWSVFNLSFVERVSQLVGGEDCGVERWSGFPVMQES